MPSRFAVLLFYLSLSSLLGCPFNLPAQHTTYLFQHLDREDGLASNMVLSILQDKQGFLWFGTNNGLQRYDGQKFTHYRYQFSTPNSLASDMVEALLEDTQGNLWIAAPGAVTLFSPGTQTFARIPIHGLTTLTVSVRRWLFTECHGQIFLSSAIHPGIYVYDSLQAAFVPDLHKHPEAPACAPCSREKSDPLPASEPYRYLKDTQGRLWAAGEKLQVKLQGSADFEVVHSSPHKRYSLDFNLIFSIIQDKEGTLWLGTDQGVYYFNPDKQRFSSIAMASGNNQQASAAVSGFLETSSGYIWVSSLNEGIAIFDQQFKQVGKLPGKDKADSILQSVWCVAEGPGGEWWAGCSGGYIARISADLQHIQYFRPPALQGQTAVKATVDAAGYIWWGSKEGLVIRQNPRTQEYRTLPLAAHSRATSWGKIKKILPGKDDYIWVATEKGGVLKVNKNSGTIHQQFTTSSRPHALLSNETGDMIWYTADTLAVSTSLGIHFIHIHDSSIRTLTTENGLPANAILDIVPANGQTLFFSTQTSVGMWNGATNKVTTYGARDGIIHQSFAFNTGYKLNDGRIMLGTLQDFFYFHPDSLLYGYSPPKVLITGIQVFDTYMPLAKDSAGNGSLQLAHNQNFFTIEFASLSYYDASKITYYYQLEGVDKEWINAGKIRFASYTDISGGAYTFKVKAERDDGLGSPPVTSMLITVEHPFWKSPWFAAGVFLLFVALIGIIYQIRLSRVLAMQRVRTRIAQDLHDDMGSTLSTIHILSELARQQAGSHVGRTTEYIAKINTYSRQLQEAIDDIVWSINPFNDSVKNLTSRMREFATELLEAKDVFFTLEVDPKVNTLHIPMETRYDFFMIFKEAIHNAAKYAQCTRVEALLEISHQTLLLTVTDNGQGFDLGSASGGNGLLNMQNRAKAIKGHIDITSQPGSGTRIRLQAPISKTWLQTSRNDKTDVI